MATIQRNYDPIPRLGLDEGVYSVPDVFAFDIGATGRKHSSILDPDDSDADDDMPSLELGLAPAA